MSPIVSCPFCQLDTAGNHQYGCPNGMSTAANVVYETPKPKGIKGRFVPYDTCDFCHEQSPFTMTFPYGSNYDGSVICVECIKKYIEPALKEFWMR